MLVQDILDGPELRLALLAGAEHVGRPVSRVYTTDLLDPSRYLTGGELVLTGLMWRRTPEDSAAFVAALVTAGVSALGAGDAALGSVPEDLVAACHRHGLPLFEVPVEVSFQDIADRVGAGRASGLAAVLGRQRDLLAAVASGAGLDELLPDGCSVVTVTGRLVAGPPPAPGDRPGDGLPGTPVRSRPDRITDWFVVSRLARSDLDDVCRLVALHRARHDEAVRVERRLAGDLVAALAGTVDVAVLRARLASCALPTDGTYVAVAATVDGLDGDAALDLVDEVVRTVAGPRCGAATLDPRSGRLIVVACAVDQAVPALRRVVGELPVRVAIGLSEPVAGAEGLRGAVEEAAHACRYAAESPDRPAVVRADELATHAVLLAGLPADTRTAFRDRLIGPLVRYDLAHDADLVRTLRTFLGCSGSWIRCAELLHVHVNTLRYRIRRVEQLTGRDLSRFEDRVDLFLALRVPD